jgi:hypothetical protein
MAMVRVVREHTNMYGDKPKKAEGDTYELPDNMAKTLSDAGLVEKMTKEEATAVEPEPAGKGAKSKH